MLGAITFSLQTVLVAGIGGIVAAIVLPSLFFQTRKNQRLSALAARQVPIPLWQEEFGKVIWCNAAYEEVARHGPPFANQNDRVFAGEDWYHVNRGKPVCFAVPVGDVVRKEKELQLVMQAMAGTFAHLPIGIAIFDRDRQLQTFNPALADLSALTPDFLSRKPSLVAFLDAMRNRNMVPEPKDWKAWRRRILQQDEESGQGTYDETWSLPGGQTYHVTGRIHLDGGFTLSITDISSDTIRNRRYRAELAVCQAVMETLDEGIAVFSMTGQLILSNSNYARLWGHNPERALGSINIHRVADHWRTRSAPTSIWDEIEDFVDGQSRRSSWHGEARLTDGRLLSCRLVPLGDGSVLVGFRAVPPGSTSRVAAVGS